MNLISKTFDLLKFSVGNKITSALWNRDSRGYRERGGIMARRAGSGGEWLGGYPAEGYKKAS